MLQLLRSRSLAPVRSLFRHVTGFSRLGNSIQTQRADCKRSFASVRSDTKSVQEQAEATFDSIWSDLIKDRGEEKMVFPKEIMWLGGAPGAGKGTNTGFIMRERGYTAAPIVVSSLLTSPEMMATKAAGGLVGDKEVISALFNTLLESEFSTGVVVDGFPRTKVQARVVHMLHDRMMALRNANRDGSKDMVFARPVFRICVLHVDENESVARQLGRGDRARAHNEKVKATGKGELQDLRPTDYDPALAAKRYRGFEESTFEALEYLGQYFIYNFVNAQGDFAAVEANIIREMEYQSSLELNPETHDMVHDLPRADEVIVHARQMLVKRLDGYSSASPNELQSVVTMLEKLCYPLVQRNVVAGECEFYYEPNAETRVESIQMAIDILSDRGFRASYSEAAPSGKDNAVEIKVRWEPPVIRKKQR